MTPPSHRHSALGIAALVISLCGLVMFAISAHYAHTPAHAQMQTLPVVLLVVLCISIGLAVLAMVMGIGSLLQHRRRRVTGVLALGLAVTLLLAQASLASWMRQQWQHAHPVAGSIQP
jgi:NADH:ubiquinone oxidoreductase subunit 6 (subunit J)